MSFVIEDNNFTRDNYGVRATRLSLLKANIDDYSTELAIETAMLAWAQNAYDAWETAIVNQSAESGEKSEAFQTSQEADETLYDKYISMKELLISRYGAEDDQLERYGINGTTSRRRADVIHKAKQLIHGNDLESAESDPNALPQAMIDILQALVDVAVNRYDIAIKEKFESKTSTKEIRNIYDVDANKMRTLLNWASTMWSKFDLRLELLGFVPAQKKGGGYPKVPAGLAFDPETNTFNWDAVDGATSYHLAYMAAEGDEDWQDAYKGSDTSVVFDPGAGFWLFKVRARNANGYGDFSAPIEISISAGLVPPVNVQVTYDEVMQVMILSWLAVPGAVSYKVYNSESTIGQPAVTWFYCFNPSGTTVNVVFTVGKRNWYHVSTVIGTEESEMSEDVYYDLPT